MAGSRALLVLAAVVATSCSLVSALYMPSMPTGHGMPMGQGMHSAGQGMKPVTTVEDICRGTSFPDLCTATAGKQAGHYDTIEVLTVLRMQVDALSEHIEAARATAEKEVKTASPAARRALEECNAFYGDVMENIGACRRAIGHKDPVTIRSTMSMVAQDLQFCDEEFRKAGEKNPLQPADQSLVNMSEICRSLSNMIAV